MICQRFEIVRRIRIYIFRTKIRKYFKITHGVRDDIINRIKKQGKVRTDVEQILVSSCLEDIIFRLWLNQIVSKSVK